MLYDRVKQRVFDLLMVAREGDRASRIVDLSLAALIVINVVAAVLQTVEALYSAWRPWFDAIEVASVAVFTVEYMLRIWSCTSQSGFERPVAGRLRFALTPLMVVDLVAIGPAYVAGLGGLDLRMLRAIRLFRLLRVLKIARYSESLQLLGRVLVAKRGELVVTLCAGAVLLLIASSLMYYAENEAQPDQFASIPAAMWWGVETLTTVGYGDVIPTTRIGKALGSAIALLGIGLFALPAGILGSGFVEELQRRRQRDVPCPHCGRSIVARPEPEPASHDAMDRA